MEVSPRQAEQIAQAYALGGTVYLTLNTASFDPGTFENPEEIVEAVNLFDQTSFTKLTQVQADVRAAAGK